jgi:hypothetical protein
MNPNNYYNITITYRDHWNHANGVACAKFPLREIWHCSASPERRIAPIPAQSAFLWFILHEYHSIKLSVTFSECFLQDLHHSDLINREIREFSNSNRCCAMNISTTHLKFQSYIGLISY